jgi:hypothetical protein
MIHLRPGDPVLIHYAAKNRLPDPRWRDRRGVVRVAGRGPGPWNVLIDTDIGPVIVPRGNVVPVKEDR